MPAFSTTRWRTTDLTLADIERDFGSDVAAIVAGCTEDKSLPWQDRKRHTIEMLRDASPEVCLVTCADKLHNARSILAEHRVIGDQVWKRFREGKALAGMVLSRDWLRV